MKFKFQIQYHTNLSDFEFLFLAISTEYKVLFLCDIKKSTYSLSIIFLSAILFIFIEILIFLVKSMECLLLWIKLLYNFSNLRLLQLYYIICDKLLSIYIFPSIKYNCKISKYEICFYDWETESN
jgi:hypothetical protein